MSTYAEHRAVVGDLKRRKVGDRKYEISRRSTGEVVAVAAQTGERGRDPYPWDVYGDDLPWMPACETLTDCIERVATELLKDGR